MEYLKPDGKKTGFWKPYVEYYGGGYQLQPNKSVKPQFKAFVGIYFRRDKALRSTWKCSLTKQSEDNRKASIEPWIFGVD